jgi:hypothetical protein
MALPQGTSRPVIKSPEFFNIQIAPLAAGGFYVSMTATTVDDEEAQLLTQEIIFDTAASIEDVLDIIRTGLI